MLRVGLTGDLGSGKSTVARMLAERGAIVLSSDEMGRALMQPGERVFDEIVAAFGKNIVAADGTLDRHKLATLAFDRVHPRVEELNAIVHPAVIEAQAKYLAELGRSKPDAIVVIESALIFSTTHTPEGTWRGRFDRILLVEAPESEKVARFVDRIAAGLTLSAEEREGVEADARRRLALQHSTDYAADCLVLHNDGDIEFLEQQAEVAWIELKKLAAVPTGSTT
jgi:dephospho-CoA kinase